MNNYTDKYIFCHIPKTGGTSVKHILLDDKNDDDIHFDRGHAKMSTRLNHARKYNITDTFKFTFVRNPWDRVVSGYAYLSQGGANTRDADFFNKHISKYSSFDDFVTNIESVINQGYFFGNMNHFTPMIDWLDRPIDFVGKLESIDADFKYIKEKLNLTCNLVTKNKSKRKHYKEYYTAKSRDIISDVYASDIEQFDYKY